MGKDSKKETSDKTIEFPEEKKVKQSKEKKREEPESDPSESDTESDVESEESSTVSEEEEEDDDAVSLSTTEILNGDPLYTILSQFFISKDGKNIADILEEMNSKLKYLKAR